MIYFRNTGPIQALSFDLDDTLYDNKPVIQRAVNGMVDHLQSCYPALAHYDTHWWRERKQQVMQANPILSHDPTQLRFEFVRQILCEHAVAEAPARDEARYVVEQFLIARAQIDIRPQTLTLLRDLRRRFPLAALTNGNLTIEQTPLADSFDIVLQAGNGLKMKPEPDLFASMTKQLALPAHTILHVGDQPHADVYGALNNGCRSAWFCPDPKKLQKLNLLPDLWIRDLEELRELL